MSESRNGGPSNAEEGSMMVPATTLTHGRFANAKLMFYYTITPFLRSIRPRWTPQQISDTRSYYWHDDLRTRIDFLHYHDSHCRDIPEWDGSGIPDEPITKAERDGALARFRSGRQCLTNLEGFGDEDRYISSSLSLKRHEHENNDVEDRERALRDQARIDALQAQLNVTRSRLEAERDSVRAELIETREMLESERDKVIEEREKVQTQLEDSPQAIREERGEAQAQPQPNGVVEALQAKLAETESNLATFKNGTSFPLSFWPPTPWERPVLPNPPHLFPKPDSPTDDENAEEYKEWKASYDDAIKAWITLRDEDEGLVVGYEKEMEEGHSWEGVKFLGKGGFGSAALWVEVDENDNIVERMVVKDCAIDDDDMIDPFSWRNRVPREIDNHVLIDSHRPGDDEEVPDGNRVSHRSLVKHLGSRVWMNELSRFRVFLEFCPRGDLHEAMAQRFDSTAEKEAAKGKGRGKRRGAAKKTIEFKPVPEKFIWYFMSELVDALLVLEQGHQDEAKEGWRALKHNDFHSGNVFLKDRKPREYGKEDDDEGMTGIHPEWPQPVLADFGRMFYDLNTDPTAPYFERDNPRYYRMVNKNGEFTRYPPDILLNENAPDPGLITSKADIWSIGSLAWILMTDTKEKAPFIKVGGPTPLNMRAFRVGQVYNDTIFRGRGYSLRLRKLVENCLFHHPDHRFSVQELREAIDQAVADREFWNGLDSQGAELGFVENVEGDDGFGVGAEYILRRRRGEE